MDSWKRLKAPALFGIGLYFGLILFGKHRETKEESQYLKELRERFQSEK